MDIETYIEEICRKEIKEQEAREMQSLQKTELIASLDNIKFTKRISIATLIVSVISLLVSIFN